MKNSNQIALIGYGKMGKIIEELAPDQKLQVAQRIDSNPKSGADAQTIEAANLDGITTAIEFTTGEKAYENIIQCARRGISVISGTTGWEPSAKELERLGKENHVGIMHSGNYSLGVNLFWRWLAQMGKDMNNFPEYDVGGYEIHHNQKKDAPSGTAKEAARILRENIERKREGLQFSSARIGRIPGTHTVLFDSEFDTLELTHTARGREGFAQGALKAAQWIQGKEGFFTMKDFMNEIMPSEAVPPKPQAQE